MANIQDSQCGKMSLGLSPPTTEKTSAASSKSSARSKPQMYLFLNRRSGKKPEASWEMIILSPGEHSTVSIGPFPREECVSTLSQILQVNVPKKYYLSPKACLGILRRASERGKALPEVLRIALEQQAKA